MGSIYTIGLLHFSLRVYFRRQAKARLAKVNSRSSSDKLIRITGRLSAYLIQYKPSQLEFGSQNWIDGKESVGWKFEIVRLGRSYILPSKCWISSKRDADGRILNQMHYLRSLSLGIWAWAWARVWVWVWVCTDSSSKSAVPAQVRLDGRV